MQQITTYTAIKKRLRSPRKRTREAAAMQIHTHAALERELEAETRRASVRRYWMEER